MKLKSTKALQKSKFSEVGYPAYSNYHNISSELVLYITHDEERKTTLLKIFSATDLSVAKAEKMLKHKYSLMCIFEDGTFLLIDDVTRTLIKLCPRTLETIISQLTDINTNLCAVLDNENFFILKTELTPRDNLISAQLTVYQQQDNNYVESFILPLAMETTSQHAEVSTLVSLGKNRFGCHLIGDNTSEFSVVIFDVNLARQTITTVGMITPKQQSVASGKVAIVANGLLLTYHLSHDGVQLWDTNTLQCIKEWNWGNLVSEEDNFSFLYTKIKPIMNTPNLLVYQDLKFFIFNIPTLTAKIIDLASLKLHSYGPMHALPNGELAIFLVSKSNDKLNTVLHFDINELAKYREHMGTYSFSKQTAYRFFDNKVKMPPEITNIILSYAYNSETRFAAYEKASELAFESTSEVGLENAKRRSNCTIS